MPTVQDCIYSICSLIRPDPSFYWSIINLALQTEERKWLWRASVSHDPRDSPWFIFGLHGLELGRWRLNQFFLHWLISWGPWVRQALQWYPWRNKTESLEKPGDAYAWYYETYCQMWCFCTEYPKTTKVRLCLVTNSSGVDQVEVKDIQEIYCCLQLI